MIILIVVNPVPVLFVLAVRVLLGLLRTLQTS